MSITAILQGKSFPELKNYIKERTPKKEDFISSTGFPAFSRKIPLLVPGTTETSYETALVGGISDYAFCLEILRFVERNKLTVFDLFFETVQINIGLVQHMEPEQWQKHQCDFHALKKGCLTYVHGSDLSIEGVIRYADQLHKLDQYHHVRREDRPRYWETFLEPCQPCVEQDVAELIKLFRTSFLEHGPLSKDSTVLLHPGFGVKTSPVGIPDLYADGVLYDFKSTKRNGYSWTDVGQVYGYCLLHALRLHFAPDSLKTAMIPAEPIRAVALYHSRFGDIETCNVQEHNRNPRTDDLEELAVMMDTHARIEHEKSTLSLLKSFANAKIARIVQQRTNGEVSAVCEPETVGYTPGDQVYDYSHGWGVVLDFIKADHGWKVKIAFEDGKTLQGDLRKVILISRKQLEQDPLVMEMEENFRKGLFFRSKVIE